MGETTAKGAGLLTPTKTSRIDLLTTPFRRFARMEASGGILLLLCTVGALGWANSPWANSYHAIWHTQVKIGLGSITVSESRHDWVNDGLMSIFFFLVGLEIKREILIGELSSLRKAAFPFIAAVGGSAVPALLYLIVAHGGEGNSGWGVPMATDIAFALGVLALLGSRVPVGLKVFVTALAIVDDIFAVLVIALFYTDHISTISLEIAVAGLSISCFANWLGIRQPAVYAAISIFVWFAVLNSGVHATIAGVLMAFTIPSKTFIDRSEFLRGSRALLDEMEMLIEHSAEEHDAIHALESQCEMIQSPLHRIEHRLQPWVSFFIMPLFAFANAGVHILGNIRAALTNPIVIGIWIGLFMGKPIGITSFAWLATKFRASMPEGVSWGQLFGASWVCGIGFTMSLFIASLAFAHEGLLDMAKIGILSASVVAGVAGAIILRMRTSEV
jgi:Na+:H+ antiporter, NhaA family